MFKYYLKVVINMPMFGDRNYYARYEFPVGNGDSVLFNIVRRKFDDADFVKVFCLHWMYPNNKVYLDGIYSAQELQRHQSDIRDIIRSSRKEAQNVNEYAKKLEEVISRVATRQKELTAT